MIIECPVPPKDFNPISATDDELEKYGFPKRPMEFEELQGWIMQMKDYDEMVEPDMSLLKRESNYDLNACNINNANSSTSLNWSCYVSSKVNIASVFGNFIQPTVKRKDNFNTYSSYWVGIGGYNTSRLVQCGTAGQYSYSDDKKVIMHGMNT